MRVTRNTHARTREKRSMRTCITPAAAHAQIYRSELAPGHSFLVRLFPDVMAALSTKNVVTALHTLSIAKTRELAMSLGVQDYVLDNIDMEYSGTTRSIKYVQAWLDSDTHATWTKLVACLKEIDMNVLAEEVEST